MMKRIQREWLCVANDTDMCVQMVVIIDDRTMGGVRLDTRLIEASSTSKSTDTCTSTVDAHF